MAAAALLQANKLLKKKITWYELVKSTSFKKLSIQYLQAKVCSIFS